MTDESESDDEQSIERAVQRYLAGRAHEEKERREYFSQIANIEEHSKDKLQEEWEAYCTLSEWWSPSEIDEFVEMVDDSRVVYPDNLGCKVGTRRVLDSLEFEKLLGIIVEGRFLRILSYAERIEITAGPEARKLAEAKSETSKTNRKSGQHDKTRVWAENLAIALIDQYPGFEYKKLWRELGPEWVSISVGNDNWETSHETNDKGNDVLVVRRVDHPKMKMSWRSFCERYLSLARKS